MANMAQMHQTKTEKMAQESDEQIARLKGEIASLNKELTNQKTASAQVTETQATADSVQDFDDAQEIYKLSEQKFYQKVKEGIKMQNQLKESQKLVAEKDKEIGDLQHRLELLQDSMRHFTSLADKEENDETFEAVIRGEFEAIQEQLEEKNKSLNAEVKKLSQELLILKSESQAQIERLKVQMIAISNRN